MLKGKNIVFGITGGIAAYKACDIISLLRKKGANIDVIMTKSATEFITPLTVQTISNNKVYTNMFERAVSWDVEHIELAQKADLFLIVPATANFIGKFANGIADDMLTTTVMATRAPIVIAPAMNTNMYESFATVNNISKLASEGCHFIEPDTGMLACGVTGKGRLAKTEDIVDYVCTLLQRDDIVRDLKGIKIAVTAGPTCEAIDPVRYITNRSSGKMGYAIAKAAVLRGAQVTLVSGATALDKPKGLSKFIAIESANELYESMMNIAQSQDIIIQSAAVADYRPLEYSDKKIKKSDDDLSIKLTRNKDVALEIGKIKGDKILIGFAAETNDLIANGKRKVEKKNLDFIVANNLKEEGAGFRGDTNIAKIIYRDGGIKEFEKMSKDDLANIILDEALNIFRAK